MNASDVILANFRKNYFILVEMEESVTYVSKVLGLGQL